MKILVVRYRFIGDTVLTVPFLRNLRKAYPDAQIDMLVGPVSGEVLLNCPYIDNLIVFDTTRKHKYENTNQKRKSFWSYVDLLKSKNYDKAYVLKRSFSSAFLVFMAGIKQRIGFNTEGRGFLLTRRVPYIKDRHEVECFLDVLKADNIPVSDNYLENRLSDESAHKINEIFKELNIKNGTKVLIHATASNSGKQWPIEYFAKIIDYLASEKKIQLFYTGTLNDAKTYDQIHTIISKNLTVKPVNLCGKLSIQDSLALISEMDFVLGIDSGTLHMAASIGIPVIGIYGPMNPNKWRAWGDIHTAIYSDLECIPCDLRKKCPKDIACLKNISPDIVIKQCNKFIDKAQNNVRTL